MKDSGIEWIGEIPEGWDVSRSKNIFRQRTSKGNSVEVLLAATQKAGMIPQNQIEGVVQVKIETDLQQFRTVHINDFVISLRSFQGGFEFSSYEGVCSPAYQVFYNYKNISHKYFRYLFKSDGFIQKMNSLTVGIREGKNIQYNDFANSLIPFPPLPEQQRIADYLDALCGEIDSAIEKLMQIIEKLQEYKRSLITQVVTKGLNPKVKMKESGIDWIGEIPEGWELNKINRLFYSIGSGTTPKDEEDFIGDIHWIQSGDINGGILDCSEKKVNQNTINKYTALKIFKAPYIIVAMYGASVGNVSISTINGCVNQACCVLSNPVQVLQYSFYAILALKPYLIWKAIGGGQPNISQAVVKQLRIPNPPLSEQQQIADYLDDKCSKIDAVIAKKQALIEKLTAYKKSLIYEVVTGKREI